MLASCGGGGGGGNEDDNGSGSNGGNGNGDGGSGKVDETSFAPADQDAFHGLVSAKRLWTLDFVIDFSASVYRFEETSWQNVVSTGSFMYSQTAPHTGKLTQFHDDDGRCTTTLTFDSSTAGILSYTCDDGANDSKVSWRIMDPKQDNFEIDFRFSLNVSVSQKEIFRSAANRWERIIEKGLPDGRLPTGEFIDDLLIDASIVEMDGPGGTLASAGPTHTRWEDGLPIAGIMEFDRDDVDSQLYNVILHEIGHVLGFGTIWHHLGLLRDPSLDADDEPIVPVPDTHFSGPLAIAAFDNAGGASYRGNKVPVENQGGPGSQDGHWRESVLGNEIMSPFVSDREEPLSAITIQSLADIGYAVDVSQANPYRLPPPGSAARRTPGRRIGLENDIRSGPVRVVDTNGRVVRIIE